jgi:ATP-dependent helicase/nuclease subunit B
MILAGLNEDVWPAVAEPGPWLSRGMRLQLGLEAPERRQGQAAHDFAMAIGNADAVLAFATRLGTSPALPSRLAQRLEAFFGSDITRNLIVRGDQWVRGARALDATGRPLRRAERPEPRPPAELRARQLSITEIETLIRSPYEIYAKHTLNLRKMAPLGEAPDARDRGNIVHDIFATFVVRHDIHAPDALEQLKALAVEAFGKLDSIAERRDIWLHRFTVAAAQFLAFERARDTRVRHRHAEIDAVWTFPNGFVLKGRADRIDLLEDGTVEILDFKTGGIPQPKDMKDFLAPQLPIEAAMLGAGAFKDIAPAPASALTYIKIGLGPEAFILNPYRAPDGYTVALVVAEMAQRLNGHVDALLFSDRLAMLPLVFPRPEGRVRFVGDFDHLMRLDEWRVNEGDDSE